MHWLPEGKKAAICFSIDDIHPAKSSDFYEAGGDLEKGRLGLVKWLLERHPQLKVTLFTTADWREISPFPTRKVLSSIPILRNYFHLAKLWPKGKMQLDKHNDFIDFLNNNKRMEIAYHGLYHCHKGPIIPIEFQNQTYKKILELLDIMLNIFEKSGIQHVQGICPPGWNAPDALLQALVTHNIKFIASSRDIITEISSTAKTNMSGLKNLPLIYPSMLQDGALVHIPCNFQATSTIERAYNIINHSGLLSIKGHIIKSAFGHIALDGIDKLYINYLDTLFTNLENKYGDDLWWCSMGEISDYIFKSENTNV